MLGTCPNCDSATTKPFYRAANIPAQSCLLISTRKDALNFPTGDLELAHCPACGFISNAHFDEKLLNYGGEYEETQGFSPTFGAFAKSLAGRLIEQYGLRGKRILELGCGKGEFITLMCEMGAAGGVGIDPAYVPGRLTSGAVDRVRFIQEFLKPEHSSIDADFVVCRHTLEHIPRTLEFLKLLRANLGNRRTPVVFEVPDTERVLREGAFWDIYYEHCSYFCPVSLRHVFELAGFDVERVWMEYDDQYLLIAARPGDGVKAAASTDDLARVAELVKAFGTTCPRAIGAWRAWLDSAKGARPVLWGAGSKGVGFLTTLGERDRIPVCVDINPYKHGKYMPATGQEVVGADFLTLHRPTHIIVMNPIYMNEIGETVRRLGLDAELLSINSPPGGLRLVGV